jgi:glyceraldehyde 3-phosphate dehydrogenase
MPELAGKIAGTAIRVPTPNVSIVDLVVQVERETTIEQVNQAFTQASQAGALKNILAVSDEPLTSIDFNHHSPSSTIDLTQTNVIQGSMVRVMSWYDNEWGFANRMLDVSKKFASTK